MKRFLLVFVFCGLLYFIGYISAAHITGLHDTSETADIIIVLGSGLASDGRPGPALTRRSLHAAELWRQGLAPLVLCTGGQSEYYPRTEADACREILLNAGLPADAVLLEERSRSTEENAINSRRIIDELRLGRVIMVSDSYHMLRARWLFARQGIRGFTSPVPFERIRSPQVYAYSLTREFIAFNWQLFKKAFRIPHTHIRGI